MGLSRAAADGSDVDLQGDADLIVHNDRSLIAIQVRVTISRLKVALVTCKLDYRAARHLGGSDQYLPATPAGQCTSLMPTIREPPDPGVAIRGGGGGVGWSRR